MVLHNWRRSFKHHLIFFHTLYNRIYLSLAVMFERSFEDLCDLKDKVNVSLLLNFLLAKHHMQHQLKFDIENAHRNSLDPGVSY